MIAGFFLFLMRVLLFLSSKSILSKYFANKIFSLGQAMVILYLFSRLKKGIITITITPQKTKEAVCRKKNNKDLNIVM
jgi:hypothetical protein